jgi:DNA-binding XRE family transcriptional regulator
MEYILGFRPYLSRAEYRRPGEPGRPVQALVSGPPERARETLASVVGPLSSFRLVEVGPPSVAPAPVRPEPEPPVGGDADDPEVVPPPPAEIVEVNLPVAAAAFRGGIVPLILRVLSRARRRAACVSQQEIARRIGISRPQLANAEAGRFGLSTEAAARFLATIDGLPERQLELGF